MEEVTMRLIVITGTCGAGKSTIKDELETYLDPSHYLCLDTDELGINWWNYAGTAGGEQNHVHTCSAYSPS